jgi:hypothetical protein|tara:strand:+ start:3738 stop:4784 length:1047 start_codon:yes stop_codon:yes gene_type:complete
MLGTYFYHEIVRKTVVSFGTLFNQIYVKHDDSNGNIESEIKVPLAYGPAQKFLARLEQQQDLNRSVQITLPRMSFEMNSISYDATRKVSVTQTFKAVDNNTKVKKVYMPVPYNLGFELNIMTKLNDDALQIVEQILPYFQPSFNITVELIDSIGEKRDIPVVLDSISFQDDYEGDFSTRRALIYTLQFTAKTYLFGPIADSTDGIIRKVQVDYYSDSNPRTAKREVRYTATPTARKDYDNDTGALLTENVTTTESIITLNDTSTFEVNDRVIIGTEIMKIKSKTSNSMTVERAFSSTIATEHVKGAKLNVLSTADDALIIPGDDFGFSESTDFFETGADFSPTRKLDI